MGREYMLTHAGLMARIIRTLRQFNIDTIVEDLCPLDVEEPDFRYIGTPRPGQDIILAKIASAERGQIVAPTGDGKSWIICQVCKMYSHTPILIVVAGRGEAKNIVDRLIGEFPINEIGRLGDGHKDYDRRITVCIRNSLPLVDSLHKKPKIILYDEVHTAAGPKTSYMLGFISEPGPKMFGFTATADMRSDGADLAVEMLFGPVIHEATYQQSQTVGNIVPIRAIMRAVPNGPSITASRTDAINRHGIWRNRIRNELIANDAKFYSATGAQVMVKVSTVEHGLELLGFLPDFAFVYSSMSPDLRKRYIQRGVINENEHPLSKFQQEQMQEFFQAGSLKKVIATCWNQGVDFPHLQVLIRADGQASDIQNTQLPGRLSRCADGKEYGLLIDYMDNWNSTLNRRALTRARRYVKNGWDVQKPRALGDKSGG